MRFCGSLREKEREDRTKLGRLEKEILMCLGKRQGKGDWGENPFAGDLAYDVLKRRLRIEVLDERLRNDRKLQHHLEVLIVSVMRALISLERKGLILSGQRKIFAGSPKSIASHDHKIVRLTALSQLPDIPLSKRWIRGLYKQKVSK